VLIDPGDQAQDLLDWIGEREIEYILITHGDADHVGALESVRATLQAPVGVHSKDAERFQIRADFHLEAGDRLKAAGVTLQVYHVPGHTPGSVAFLVEDPDGPPLAVVGDAIFPGGPGHTRSPEDLRTALEALAATVFTWPDETTLHPGHGDPTTVGAERAAFAAFTARPLPPGLHGDVTWR
jgi:glyoxylase-like metal-dependent hydrolase (beta-lactamase superfamily II)